MVMGGSTCFVAMLVSYGYIKYRSIKDRDEFRKYVRQGNLDPENVESNENTLRLEEEVSRMVVVMMISFTILNLPSKFFFRFLLMCLHSLIGGVLIQSCSTRTPLIKLCLFCSLLTSIHQNWQI